MRLSRYLCLALLLALPLGCDSTSEVFNFTFSPRGPDEEPNIVALRYADHSERTLTVGISVEGLDLAPVSGATFDLLYGADLLEFREYRVGTFLEEGGAVTYQVEDVQGEVGLVRVHVTQAAGTEPVTGDGALLEIKFRARDEGITFLDFQEARLLGELPDAPPLGGIHWFGALVSIY